MNEIRQLFVSNPRLYLSDKRTVRNALKDIIMDDIGMMHVLIIAFDCIDMHEELRKEHSDLALDKGKWIKRLQDEYYIQPQIAKKAIDMWCELFTDDLADIIANETEKLLMEKAQEEAEKQEEERKIQLAIAERQQKYIDEFSNALSANRFDEAEMIISSAVKAGFTDFISYRAQIIEKRAEIDRGKKLLNNNRFMSYDEGIQLAASLLDGNPDSVQAKIWLQNNPRTEPVTTCKLYFRDGEDQAIVSWEDDDQYSCYTVRRAVGRYPSDPDDGESVCEKITNKKVTDHLPENKAGAIWHYSIFAIRILDGQWVKTDCPGETVWLPEPSDMQFSLEKDRQGKQMVVISWEIPPSGCEGISIVRYSDEDEFSFSETIVDIDYSFDSVQHAHRFVDQDINHRTRYRYSARLIWKFGSDKRTSKTIIREIIAD